MALSLEKIKKDFVRNKKRSAVLGVLVLVMVGFVVKAYFEMAGPRNAAANTTTVVTDADGTAEPTMSAAETDARIKQSKELWKALRVERGVPANAAFSFVPSFYNPDPSRQRTVLPTVVEPNQVSPAASINAEEINRRKERLEIEAAARKLVVNTIVVGKGNSRPVAIVNSQVVGIGDTVSGFEVIAITADNSEHKDQSYQVVFKKGGVTVPVKMAGASVPSDVKPVQ